MADNMLARYEMQGPFPNALAQARQPEEPTWYNALWNARPWQGYAQSPPSMLPQLAIALGLLHPRLGGATRDMSMARMQWGENPAYMPGDSLGRSDITMSMAGRSPGVRGPGINIGQSGTGYGPSAPDPAWINFRNPNPANVNMRDPRVMRPDLKLID